MEWKLSLKIDLQSPVPIEAGITALLYLQYLCMLVTGYRAGVQSADALSNPSSVITRHQQPAAASSRIQAGHGDGTRKICTGCNNTNNTQHSARHALSSSADIFSRNTENKCLMFALQLCSE